MLKMMQGEPMDGMTKNSFSKLREFFNAKSDQLFTITILTISLVSMLLLAEITRRHGVGLQNDSVVYIAGAKNWLQGNGISWISGSGKITPITHYPPLYSLLLAGLQVCAIPILEGAKVLNIAILGINIFLIGIYLNQATSYKVLALSGVLLFLLAPGIFSIHTWGLTDCLFIMFCLLAMYMMAKYLSERKNVFLITSGISVGLGYLLRYVGISLFIALVLILLLEAYYKKLKILAKLTLFSALSLMPIIFWYLRNFLLTGSISTYQFIIYEGNRRDMVKGLSIIMDWFLPGRLVNILNTQTTIMTLSISIMVILLTILAIALIRQNKVPTTKVAFNHIYLAIPCLFFCVYISVLYSAATFTYIPPTIDERTLAPGYFSLLLVLIGFAAYTISTNKRAYSIGVFLVIAFLLINKYSWTTGLATQARFNGLGYSSLAWQDSETLDAIKDMETTIIYTDNTKAMYILADKITYAIPTFFHANTSELFPNTENPDIFWERMREENAILALVGEIAGVPGGTSNEIISDSLSLLYSFHDGAIYTHPTNIPATP